MSNANLKDVSRKKHRPVATWVFMLLAVVVVLLQPNWIEAGGRQPFLLSIIPILLGFAGAYFALRHRYLWWGILSIFWGFIIILVFTVSSLIYLNLPSYA